MGFTPVTRRRRAAVVGLGVSGRAAAALLAESEYEVVIYDQAANALPPELASTSVCLHTIADPEAMARALITDDSELLVVSPGLPETSPVFVNARRVGMTPISEVELAWRAAGGGLDPGSSGGEQSRPQAPWLAVTGTNGKTTTVGMTDAILRAAGVSSIQTGNVGYPITRAVRDDHEVLVCELSSFQLAATTTLAPWASICLNVDADHLDWHGTAKAYREAKAKVYDRTRCARFAFADDLAVMSMARSASQADRSALIPLVFGEVEAGQIGVENGILVDRALSDSLQTCDLREVSYLRDALGGADAQRSPLLRDCLAAAALALTVGVTGEDILAGLSGFRPAPHRFSTVPTSDGRRWIDDSKATNEHAAAAALANADAAKTVWIVGGDTKGQDLTGLVHQAAHRIKAAVVIGADQGEILDAFASAPTSVPVVSVAGVGEPASWMREVVRACAGLSDQGDTVLLAPACASWDQFSSYSQRGEIFQEAVRVVTREG